MTTPEKIVGVVETIGAMDCAKTSDTDQVIITITTTVSEVKNFKRNLIYREVEITLTNQPETKP